MADKDNRSRFLHMIFYIILMVLILINIPSYESQFAAHTLALVLTLVGSSAMFVGAVIMVHIFLTKDDTLHPLADILMPPGLIGVTVGQIIYDVQTHRTVSWANIVIIACCLLALLGPGSGGKRRQAAKLLGEKSRALRDKLTSSAPAPKTGDATP